MQKIEGTIISIHFFFFRIGLSKKKLFKKYSKKFVNKIYTHKKKKIINKKNENSIEAENIIKKKKKLLNFFYFYLQTQAQAQASEA